MYEGDAKKGSGQDNFTFGIENCKALEVWRSNDVSWLPKTASLDSGTIVFNSVAGVKVLSRNLSSVEKLGDCIKKSH